MSGTVMSQAYGLHPRIRVSARSAKPFFEGLPDSQGDTQTRGDGGGEEESHSQGVLRGFCESREDVRGQGERGADIGDG